MKKISTIILSLILAIPLFAQSERGSSSLILINTNNSELEIAKLFIKSMGQSLSEPKAPSFLFYSKRHNVAFGMGGFVRLRTSMNFGGSPTNTYGFIPNSIPVPADPTSNAKFFMDPSKSTLFFKLIGDDESLGRYEAYISGEFTGNNYSFVLNDAYVKFNRFVVGRTWSTFTDVRAIPPTVDFQGPNGASSLRTSQIRYTQPLGRGWEFAAAIEMPHITATYTDYTEAITQRIPDIPAYFQYSWGFEGKSHVRAAAVLRNMNYRDLKDDQNRSVTGFGVQFSNNIVLSDNVEIFSQIDYGKGIAQYINDLQGMGVSMLYNPNNVGRMRAGETLSWYANLKYNFTKSIYATAGYSQARVYNYDDSASDDAYRYGQYVVANLFWDINNSFQFGVEYLWGDRVNFDNETNHANCIQAMMQFNF